MTWHPLRFHPLYQERVWGGRALQARLGRSLASASPIGESWEISDRTEAQSVVAQGPLAGRTLNALLREDPVGLLGEVRPRGQRFPLLLKILDAQAVLSLQVHPPAEVAARLGGEAKTELWYFLHAEPGSEIFVGLCRGTNRESFEHALDAGRVAECFHRLAVEVGDVMYLPRGRAHALGAGLLLFEVQENSDTTYRVYDWDRVGLDGRPRPLHREESLASIDFADHEPSLAGYPWKPRAFPDGRSGWVRPLVAQPPFGAELRRLAAGERCVGPRAGCEVFAVARGRLRIGEGEGAIELAAGETGLLPAALSETPILALEAAEWLAAWPLNPASPAPRG